MKVGEVANVDAAGYGKPLDGVRILAVEQMQALPWGTQLLSRLGADVVKIEPPGGDSARGAQPGMLDPEGRSVGTTFLRNNLNKRSVCVNLKDPRGVDLVLRLAARFDVFAENLRGGAMSGLGLGYEVVSGANPRCIYLSISGFGNTTPSPYRSWPAYAPIVEAMSGIYEFKREGDRPPLVAPVGGLGDIGTSMFGVIGLLAALRHRDQTGRGQHVDVAMLDSMVAMTDLVVNFWSMGMGLGDLGGTLMRGFRAADGWFILFIGREIGFQRLATLIGREEWLTDPRLATRRDWDAHLEDVIRPAVESWAAGRTKLEACRDLSAAGIAAGPCFSSEEVVHDPHLAQRDMLVELDRTDGVPQPVLIPGNPVKMSLVSEGPETRIPWVGEHTDEVLGTELGLSEAELGGLRADGVVA